LRTRPGRLSISGAMRAVFLVLAAGSGVSALGAQGGGAEPAIPPELREYFPPAVEGETVVKVEISGLRRLPRDVVLHLLQTRKGSKLEGLKVRKDIEMLWRRFKMRAEFRTRKVPGGVEVLVLVHEFRMFGQLGFRGIHHFTEKQVREFLDIREGEGHTELSGNNLARLLEEKYRVEGYPFARVTLDPRPKEDLLVLDVDEGPKVKVREIRFRGNRAFPSSAFLGLTWNLLGSADIKSKPGFWILEDAAYNEKDLEQDLQRLRNFYRGRGYMDAIVELEDLRFSKDLSQVAITVRIFEGPLYKVAKVDLEQIPPSGSKEPLFPKEELLKEIRLRPGDPPEENSIAADRRRLAAFYGRRGFPRRSRFPLLDRDGAFEVLEPVMIADPRTAEVTVIYRVQEGRRKRIRDVRISGNRLTRDSVIRRAVSVFPGEMLDMVELERSEDRLRALRYFGDVVQAGSGVRVDLKPVPDDPDAVDVDISVKEGSTGKLLWGIGVSSTTGLFGNLTYSKENFDWRRPPTGINPIGWLGQILDQKAFHGGGQRFNLIFSPGLEVSEFLVSFYEPDVFARHLDPIGLRITGQRRLRIFETYDQDTMGGSLGLEKRFGRDLTLSLKLRQERVRISDIDADAPAIVWDADGKHEIRSFRMGLGLQRTDLRFRPTSGTKLTMYGEIAPREIGGQVHFWKAGIRSTTYIPLHKDSKDRSHVLSIRNWLEGGDGMAGQKDLFLSERYFHGGQNLMRGFDFQGMGPTQFGNPTGGELRWAGGVEYGFPLISTRLEGQGRQTELVRGVLFVDAGMLGDGFHDPQFQDLRLSWGFGARLLIPGLGGIPISVDLAWPILREESDDTRVFHFSLKY